MFPSGKGCFAEYQHVRNGNQAKYLRVKYGSIFIGVSLHHVHLNLNNGQVICEVINHNHT